MKIKLQDVGNKNRYVEKSIKRSVVKCHRLQIRISSIKYGEALLMSHCKWKY